MAKQEIIKPENNMSLICRGQVKQGLGITRRKYLAAMKEAEDLLYGSREVAASIQDSLNCGKLGRLLNYIRTGSVYLLLWFSYAELATH